MQSKVPKNFNLKSFVQSEEYEVLKNNLQKELNHNSQAVNISLNYPSNLLEYKPKEKMFFNERLSLRQAKNKYKPNEEQRTVLFKQFLDCDLPSFNLKFCDININ